MRRLLPILALLVVAVPASAAAPRMVAWQDLWPVWSPDGTKIAVTRVYSTRNHDELVVVDLKTKSVTSLAVSSYQPAPSWSPDSTHLAYQAGGDVYITDLRGAKRRVGRGIGPAYGPQLARIVGTTLYVGSKPWASHVFGRPSWSPDGMRIAFQRADGIYVTDGTAEKKWATTQQDPGPPVWSPDGAQIAYRADEMLYVASPGIVPPRAVSDFVFDMGDPSWAPTGDALVASSQHGVVLWRLSGTHRVLHPAAGAGAAFSPESPVVAYIGPRPSCPGHFGLATDRLLTGTCDIRGTNGPDVIEGTGYWGDVIIGLGGNDKIYANDRHTDRILCGPGRDSVWADKLDKLTGCEIVHR